MLQISESCQPPSPRSILKFDNSQGQRPAMALGDALRGRGRGRGQGQRRSPTLCITFCCSLLVLMSKGKDFLLQLVSRGNSHRGAQASIRQLPFCRSLQGYSHRRLTSLVASSGQCPSSSILYQRRAEALWRNKSLGRGASLIIETQRKQPSGQHREHYCLISKFEIGMSSFIASPTCSSASRWFSCSRSRNHGVREDLPHDCGSPISVSVPTFAACSKAEKHLLPRLGD
jgi:hypothetical protein